MKNTVYVKLNQITELTHKDVVLKDVAQVYCDDQNIMNKCNAMKVMTVKLDKKRRYIMSALDVTRKLIQMDPTLEVSHVGEVDFIIAYKPPSPPSYIWEWSKTVFVCAVCFFGAAFAIMTFNNDVNVTDVFGEVYRLVMGYESGGFTVNTLSLTISLTVRVDELTCSLPRPCCRRSAASLFVNPNILPVSFCLLSYFIIKFSKIKQGFPHRR